MFDIRSYEISMMNPATGDFQEFYCIDLGAKSINEDGTKNIYEIAFTEDELNSLNRMKEYATANDIPFDEMNRFLFTTDEERTFATMKFLTVTT